MESHQWPFFVGAKISKLVVSRCRPGYDGTYRIGFANLCSLRAWFASIGLTVPSKQPHTEDGGTLRSTSTGLRFDLRALFLIVGFLALATAALTWRDRSMTSALFVCAASFGGIVATISRNRHFATILIVIVLIWLLVVLGAMVATVVMV